ncbi:hypothetical protein HY604_05380 [Candidatus Peregrinibacteria bacterium]|nr:hypothetical protein [Candidatus Peregrinibacteria bacterium]
MRIHSGLKKLFRKVDATEIANRGDDYLEALKLNRSCVNGVSGLVGQNRIRDCIKRIDTFECEMLALEGKMERVAERREDEALKLQDYLDVNMEILGENLSREEMRGF